MGTRWITMTSRATSSFDSGTKTDNKWIDTSRCARTQCRIGLAACLCSNPRAPSRVTFFSILFLLWTSKKCIHFVFHSYLSNFTHEGPCHQKMILFINKKRLSNYFHVTSLTWWVFFHVGNEFNHASSIFKFDQ